MRLVIGGTGPARIDHTLVKVITKAYGWWQDVLAGMSITAVAAREGMDRGDLNKRLHFAFLAPGIIEAIMTGHQPADLSTEKLLRGVDLPQDWAGQKSILGIT